MLKLDPDYHDGEDEYEEYFDEDEDDNPYSYY